MDTSRSDKQRSPGIPTPPADSPRIPTVSYSRYNDNRNAAVDDDLDSGLDGHMPIISGIVGLPFAAPISLHSSANAAPITVRTNPWIINSQSSPLPPQQDHQYQTNSSGNSSMQESSVISPQMYYSARSLAGPLAATREAMKSPAIPPQFASFMADSVHSDRPIAKGVDDSADYSSDQLNSINIDGTGRSPLVVPSAGPPAVSSRAFVQPSRNPSSIYSKSSKRPIVSYTPMTAYEKLLPDADDAFDPRPATTATRRGLSQSQKELKLNDVVFAIAYMLSLALMISLGVYFELTTTPFTEDIRNSVYYAFDKTSKHIGTLLFFSFAIGLAWVIFLQRFLRAAIWMMVFTVPGSFFAISIWGFSAALSGPIDLSNISKLMIPESLISLILGIASSYLIHKKKHHIGNTVKLVEVSFEIIFSYPALILVCLGILLGYLVFCAVWLSMFSHLMLIGRVESKEWIASASSNWLAAFFIFMFLWTSSVFHYLERTTISAVVCEWYFHRHNPVKNIWKNDLPTYALKRSLTLSFGSICYAAAIMSFVQVAGILCVVFKRICRFTGTDNTIGAILQSIVRFLESMTDGLNAYALVYVAYSGTDFKTAVSASIELFRRNLISAILTENFAKFILLLGVYAVSLASFTATFTYSIRTAQTPYAMLVSSIAAVLSYFLTRFCTLILVQVMDALYVCYVIDIDKQECHSQAVHLAFSGTSNPHEQASKLDVY
eukprot:Partr_v1_DN28271_c0_g1_i3_m75535 putative Solute carrier family 44 member